MDEIKVLLTGAGAPGAPGIIQCLKNNKERHISIVGVDIKDKVPTILELDKFFSIPKADNDRFLESILKICLSEGINILIPLVTKELEVISNSIDSFENKGITVLISPTTVLETANDKGLLLKLLQNKGVEVPRFRIVNKKSDFIDACSALGFPKNVICFKPTKSNGSRGFRIIDRDKDLKSLLFNEKPNNLYITYEEILEIIKNESFPELLVCEYLPGSEYSVDILANHGQIIVCIPRLRMQMNGGISTKCLIENNAKIIEYCRSIISILALHGNIGIQVRMDEQGNPKILEINPRLQGSVVACMAAGVNLPYLGIKLFLNEEIREQEIVWGTMMIRYWKETFFDTAGHAFTL